MIFRRIYVAISQDYASVVNVKATVLSRWVEWFWRRCFALLKREKTRVKEIQGVLYCLIFIAKSYSLTMNKMIHALVKMTCPKGPLNCLNPESKSWELCGIVSWGAECADPGRPPQIIANIFVANFISYACFPRTSGSVHSCNKISFLDQK